MEMVPTYVRSVFVFTTFLSIILLRRTLVEAAMESKKVWFILGLLIVWLFIQDLLASGSFYTNFEEMPPRFILAIGPPLLCIFFLFLVESSRDRIASLPLLFLTAIHILRIPVELVLYWLSEKGMVPILMTFEGRNFDILSGLSAPLVMYFGIYKQQMSRKALIAWNVVCLVLLVNIVANAILSTPYPFQQQAFDHPNVAVFYFPFIWLPSLIVPMVLFAHLAALLQLSRRKEA